VINNIIISASWDKTLKLWDLESGKLLFTYSLNKVLTHLKVNDDETIIGRDTEDKIHCFRIA